MAASPAPDTTSSSTARADTARPPASATATAQPAPAPAPSVTPSSPPVPTAARPDTARPDSAPSGGRAGRSGARFRIQITAVRTAAAAQSIAAKLKARGLRAMTVEEGGLYKVRVGEYATKAEALAAVPEIKAKVGGSPFVVAES
jgi:cell division septation protein DedD